MPSAPRPTPIPDVDPAPWNPEPTEVAADGAKERWRRRLLIGLAIIVAVAAGFYGVNWFLVGRFLETTDDAYLQADNAVVAPKVTGYIASVDVADNQMVAAGQVLAQIDDRDYRSELEESQADLAQANAEIGNIAAQIEQQKSRLAQNDAALASSGAAAEFAGQEAERFNALVQSGAVSLKQAQQGRSELKRATASVAESKAMLDAARKQIEILESDRAKAAAALKRAEAAVEQAQLRLSYTQLAAPRDGAIGDRSVRVGQFVQPGTRLLTIVPIHDTYLVANFKETQLRAICRGEQVRIALDTYPDLAVTGMVDSLAPGTGAQFALLPSENATGNFTKIVQRVPVKILIDRKSLGGVELRPGLSATATVDTRTAPEGNCATMAPGAGAKS